MLIKIVDYTKKGMKYAHTLTCLTTGLNIGTTFIYIKYVNYLSSNNCIMYADDTSMMVTCITAEFPVDFLMYKSQMLFSGFLVIT